MEPFLHRKGTLPFQIKLFKHCPLPRLIKPYSRPKLSDFYTLSQNKLPEKRTLHIPIWLSIELFRQMLSRKSVKAYATMPIGIMGSNSVALLY